MANYVSLSEAAGLVGRHRSRLHALVQQGRVKGARKVGRVWVVPLGKDGLPQVELRGPGRPRMR